MSAFTIQSEIHLLEGPDQVRLMKEGMKRNRDSWREEEKVGFPAGNEPTTSCSRGARSTTVLRTIKLKEKLTHQVFGLGGCVQTAETPSWVRIPPDGQISNVTLVTIKFLVYQFITKRFQNAKETVVFGRRQEKSTVTLFPSCFDQTTGLWIKPPTAPTTTPTTKTTTTTTSAAGDFSSSSTSFHSGSSCNFSDQRNVFVAKFSFLRPPTPPFPFSLALLAKKILCPPLSNIHAAVFNLLS